MRFASAQADDPGLPPTPEPPALPEDPSDPDLPPPLDAVEAPDALGEAAKVLGLAREEARKACATFGLPDPTAIDPEDPGTLITWAGEGYDSVVTRARKGLDEITPQELVEFLRHQESRGQSWARHILWLIDTCEGQFAFCATPVLVAGVVEKWVTCSTCCKGDERVSTCATTHVSAGCGCVSE